MIRNNRYNTFLRSCILFKQSIDDKIPGYLKKNGLSVKVAQPYPVCLADHQTGEMPGLENRDSKPVRNTTDDCCYVSLYELLRSLEDIFECDIKATGTACPNPIDKLFHNLIYDLIVPYQPIHEHSDRDMSSTAAPPELSNYNRGYTREFLDRQTQLEREADSVYSNLEERTCYGENRQRLTYYVVGNKNSPVLILINAYSMSPFIWKYLIKYFSRTYKIITWLTRGTNPEDSGHSLTVRDHAEDVSRILDRENVQTGDFICWCSGLKILVEYWSLHPEKFKTITIINGLFEPLDDAGEIKNQYATNIEKLSRLVVAYPNMAHYSRELITKFIDPERDRNSLIQLEQVSDEHNGLLERLIKSASSPIKPLLIKPFTDKDTLLNFCVMTLCFRSHNIMNYLSDIKVPVLMIIGEQDAITPHENALFCSEKINKCRSVLLKNGTHWCLWEDHETVNSIIKNHLALSSP